MYSHTPPRSHSPPRRAPIPAAFAGFEEAEEEPEVDDQVCQQHISLCSSTKSRTLSIDGLDV